MVDYETAIHPAGRSIQIRMEDPKTGKAILGSGAEGQVRRVSTIVERNGKYREVNLVHKKFEHPADIKKHMEVYRELQRLGLPVPSTFRETSDGILMTDLTDNGRNLVLSYNELNRKRLYFLKQKVPQLFDKFNSLDLSKIIESMQTLIEKASLNEVNFDNVDTWTFIMKPDGTYSFILNDLLNIKLHETPSDRLKNENLRTFETFAFMLEWSQETIDSSRDILTTLAKVF